MTNLEEKACAVYACIKHGRTENEVLNYIEHALKTAYNEGIRETAAGKEAK